MMKERFEIMRWIVTCSLSITFLTCLIHSTIFACSVVRNYVQPTNYDLVKEADAIILAEASKIIDGFDDEDGNHALVEFKILKTLKGDVGIDIFRTTALTHIGFLGRSKDDDFSEARPGAYAGMCTAMDYRPKHRYLLFLEKVTEDWIIMLTPWARVNEEVAGLDSPWAKAVQAYINISALNDYEKEKHELRKLLKRDADLVPGLAEDIIHYFSRASEQKSFNDNLFIYENSQSKIIKGKVLWVFANAKDERAMPLVHELLNTGEWKQYIPQVSTLIAATKDEKGFQILYDELPGMTHYIDRANAISAIIAIADEKDMEKMLILLRTINSRDKRKVAQWFIKHPSEEALDIMRTHVGCGYTSNRQSAFVLSAMGDADILEWAKEFMKSEDEYRWMAFYVVARSTLPESNDIAREVIHGDDTNGRTWLIQGYEDSSNPNKFNLLAEVIQTNPTDEEVKKWLKSVLKTLAYRDGENRAKELLELLEY
jgi:hypothetical protein